MLISRERSHWLFAEMQKPASERIAVGGLGPCFEGLNERNRWTEGMYSVMILGAR